MCLNASSLKKACGTLRIGGDGVIVPLLTKHLSPRVSELVVDILPIDIRAAENEIQKATMESLRDDNVHTDAEKVRELLDRHAASRTGRARPQRHAQGVTCGQVDELILSAMPQEFSDAGTPEQRSRFFTGAPDGLRASWSEAVGLLVNNAIRTRAAISFIEDPELLKGVGGAGAFLIPGTNGRRSRGGMNKWSAELSRKWKRGGG